MSAIEYARKLKRFFQVPPWLYRLKNQNKPAFLCPLCRYKGPFKDLKADVGTRLHAQCPKCGALERHRLQYLVIDHIMRQINAGELKMLHFAPEPFFSTLFAKAFGVYETADLCMKGVDHRVNLLDLPFKDSSYDFIFSSHVLEHIDDDIQALNEIHRVLSPNGIAILPVPIVCTHTVEYPEPNPNEFGHVRAPGFDYFDRYDQVFSSVDRLDSESFNPQHQLYLYEDRTAWPSKSCPLRPPMQGEKHIDIVPVCYA